MPEIITKYPESLIKTLNHAGAKCGVGSKQQILTKCPSEKFCALPAGEICVYSVNDIPSMTQIKLADIEKVIVPLPTIASWENIFIVLIAYIIGMWVGMKQKK